MSDFITLGCPSCGGNLAVTSDAERFACPYCKREHLVRRSGGHVSLVPIIEKLERITEGVDRHASELAIQRLREDRRILKKRIHQQQDLAETWRRRQLRTESDLAGKRRLSVVALVFAWCAGSLAVGFFIAGSGASACLGVVLGASSVGTGLVGLIARGELKRRTDRVDDAQQQLQASRRSMNESYAELERVETELEHHLQVVRRA